MGWVEVDDALLEALGLESGAGVEELLLRLKERGLPPEGLLLDPKRLAGHLLEMAREGTTSVSWEEIEAVLRACAREHPEWTAALYGAWCSLASEGVERVQVGLALARRWRDEEA